MPKSVPHFSGAAIKFTATYPAGKGRGVRTPFLRFATAFRKGGDLHLMHKSAVLIGVTHAVIDEMFAHKPNRKEEEPEEPGPPTNFHIFHIYEDKLRCELGLRQ